MNSHVANTESLAFVRNVRMTFSQHHCGKENSMTQIQYLLNEVARRMKAKGTPDFYKPFTEEESRLLREHYARSTTSRRRCSMPITVPKCCTFPRTR
jgi:hypothetical protein